MAISLQARTAAVIPDTAWHDEPLSALVRHILDSHHAFTRSQLRRLDQLSRAIVAADGAGRPEHALLAALADDLGPHLHKEELMLFPYVLAMDAAGDGDAPSPPFGSVENPVRMMNLEHDQVADLLRQLREVTDDYLAPPEASATTRDFYAGLAELDRDLVRHIHLETDVLFPRAVALESGEDD
jgi:regulator of cell morphogenesis and NO signaling